jgi:hypothetical protein
MKSTRCTGGIQIPRGRIRNCTLRKKSGGARTDQLEKVGRWLGHMSKCEFVQTLLLVAIWGAGWPLGY